MGIFSLAGSFFPGIGTAVGGLLDWLTGGGGSSKPKAAPTAIGFMDLEGLPNRELPAEQPNPMSAGEYGEVLSGMTQPLWGQNPLLDGRGGGGTGKTSTTPTTPGTNINQFANQQGGMNTAGLEGMANVVLGKAMQGQMNNTPYQVASQNLVQATNRTGQQTTQTLMSNLAQRGLANSGLQARGIAEVGAATAQAKAQGLAQISAQQAQAQNQQVQWAAQTAIDASLRAQQLALQARSLGIQQQQIDQQAQSNLFNMLGGLGNAIGGNDWMSGDNSWLGGLFGGGGGNSSGIPGVTTTGDGGTFGSSGWEW
jgi:hypothetical protein